ncbi:MAG: DNA primase [Porticoccus sp.]|nr:DNA primase [Porticoccus sp.]MBQ0808464.1 DNA primase [Porticoccus sp.]MDX2350322.1 DNA primase [Porticoccus sp.]
MAGRIPQTFIDDVLDRVDIVDVVGSRLDLRKSGKNHSACCPFHDEKTPSFTVSQDKQFYYCFGCGAGGNAIGFVIDFDRMSFPEAVENLAKHVGLEVPREASHDEGASQRRKALYDIMDKADQFYRSSLRNHPAAHEAVDYLKSRALSGETARNFGIGFAPPGWDNLLQNLGQTDETIGQLKESGLLIERTEENKRYDRFRHRIMFPIRDVRGRTIGFGGRVLGDDKPKYLNSPETPLFHKGRELYGLFEANQKLRDIPNLLVVEGYMDVAALAQHGIHNAVATLGTAATPEHLDKLFRYTSEVVYCFDGDDAGRKAAHRALETSLPVMFDGRTAKFLFLPDGEDPDTLVREVGSDKFLRLVQSATPISDFLFESVSEGLDVESLDGRARLSKLAAPMINRMPLGVFKALMLKTLSQKTGLDTDTLSGLIEPIEPVVPEYDQEPPAPEDTGDYPEYYGDAGLNTGHANEQTKPRQRDVLIRREKRVKMPPIHTLIALLANHPELVSLITDINTLSSLEVEGIDILVPLVKVIQENPTYTFNHILAYWRGIHDANQAGQLIEIAATDLLRPTPNSNRDNNKEFQDILNQLLRHSTGKLVPLELLQYLATKEAVDDHDLKHLNTAWLNLSEGQRTEETKTLFNQILGKPRLQ